MFSTRPLFTPVVSTLSAPPPAAGVGYNSLIFSDDFINTSTIDITNSQAPGFHWYLANWFVGGSVAINANNISVTGSVLTIGNGTGSAGPAIVSAFDTGSVDAFKGTVFGNGCYIEVRMNFDPSLSGGSAGGAPNFYGMSIEHIADGNSVSKGQWPGQVSGYAHFIEVDIFETLGGSTTSYQSNNHDWGGVAVSNAYPQNIFNGATNIISTSTPFTSFNTYGMLWVPQNGSTPGYLQRYLNNSLVQSLYYLGPPGAPPLPQSPPGEYSPSIPAQADRTYSVIDGQHLAILLGGGLTWPIHIDWINIWR